MPIDLQKSTRVPARPSAPLTSDSCMASAISNLGNGLGPYRNNLRSIDLIEVFNRSSIHAALTNTQPRSDSLTIASTISLSELVRRLGICEPPGCRTCREY